MKVLVAAIVSAYLGTALVCAPQVEKPAGGAPAQAAAKQAESAKAAPNKAEAYYHYALAHMYEEMGVAYNRQEYLSKALEEYKLAMQNDPTSPFLSAELADLYARTDRIRDAVLEAEDVLRRDPNNLEARKLLGRIYLRVLDNQSGGGRGQSDVRRRAIEQFEKITELAPKDAESKITLGRLYHANSDYTKAEAVLKQALALQPESEEALTRLAFLYTDTSQLNAAVELLQKVTSKNPTPRLFAVLASAYEQARDYENAVKAYRRALELDKDNLDYLRGLGQNLLFNEQYEEALVPYKQVAAADSQDGSAFLRLGQIYRQLHKYDLALENLKRAESLVPNSLEAPYNLALLEETEGRPEAAISMLKGLLERTAKSDGAQHTPREKANRAIFQERLGILYRSNENYAAAEEAFRQMMDSDSENAVRGASQIIDTLRQQKEFSRALAEADAALQRFPDERGLKMLRAQVLGESGRVDEANQALKAMLEDKAGDREVLLAMAQVNERAKRYPQAEQAAAAAARYASRKDEKEFVYFLWGSILERQKKYDAAEEQFKLALAANPNSAMTLNYLGYMLADRGLRLEEARKYIETALDHDPNNGAYLDSMGWVYYQLNRLDQAEQYLLRAIQRVPRDATILDHLGDVYYKTGRLHEASLQWQKALGQAQRPSSSDTDPQDIAKIQKKLDDVKVRLAQETRK
jgi:tetratricopeptide (TPR) repeat protein